MKTRRILSLALGLTLLGQWSVLSSEAARKYYPPGFTPPSDAAARPETPPASDAAPFSIPTFPSKQIIIKTVPVFQPPRIIKTTLKPSDPLDMLLAEHRYYDALRMVNDRLKKSPNSMSLQLLRGKILQADGDYGQAITQFEIILDKSRTPNMKACAWNGIGWTYYQKAQHDKSVGDNNASETSLIGAEAAFRQATLQWHSQAIAWAGLGRSYIGSGRLKDASAAIKTAMGLSPDDLQVQLAQAELLLAKDKPEESLQQLYGIKSKTVSEPDVYLLLAKASIASGKTDDAIINLKQLLQLVPEHAEALKLLSLSYELKMKPEDAEEVLEKTIALNPADVNSVQSLLMIYDQRGNTERSLLLLKTLLRSQPQQVEYANDLLSRLNDNGQWEESYQEGRKLIQVLPQDGSLATKTQLDFAVLFAQAVYQKGRSLLDRRVLWLDPTVKRTRQLALDHLKAQQKPSATDADPTAPLLDTFILLSIDPLAPLPALPILASPPESALPVAIQVAYIGGNWPLHQHLLERAKMINNPLEVARQLYNWGDYAGAQVITDAFFKTHPGSLAAKDLDDNILDSLQEGQEQLDSLAMLPSRIADSYWQRAATEALRMGWGDPNTHVVVARELEQRHQFALALLHEQLAIHYATNAEDRQRWLKKAGKMARNLERANAASRSVTTLKY